MPLTRDQKPESNLRNAVSPAPTGHQYAHSILSDLSHRSRPTTPQNEMDTTSVRRESANPSVSDGGRKHQLDEDGLGVAQSSMKNFKLPAVNTMQKPQFRKSEQSGSTRFQGHNPRQDTLRASTGMTKTRKADKEKESAFDDTESIGQSMFDDSMGDGQITSRNLQQVEQHSEQQVRYIHEYDQREDMDNLRDDFVSELGPDWEVQLADEKQRLSEKGIPFPNTVLAHEEARYNDVRPQDSNPFVSRLENARQPDTPTRTHSAPPVKAPIHAPVARKTVGFSNEPEYYNHSPGFRSSEMDREDSPIQPVSRPNSAQPRVPIATVQVNPRFQQQVHSQSRHHHSALPAQSDRFSHPRGHLEAVRQGGEKVSAPESDNQDWSEDERTQTQQQYIRQDKPFDSGTHPQSAPSRKRSVDDMSNDLDYSHADLRKKTLSALQAEASTRDPKADLPPPPTDIVGNEMTLSRILENLSKVSEDAQRETFKNLTDEQWANTGRWFVDRFQADLKRLTEIRLQRRQIALRFEDAIRRRQRLVEHHEAQVDKELKELQTGGMQLVSGRKHPGTSRSNTPMKGGR